jgi:hypothetical protein
MKIYISKSRNIYNLDELQSCLDNWAEEFDRDNVRAWIKSNLKIIS